MMETEQGSWIPVQVLLYCNIVKRISSFRKDALTQKMNRARPKGLTQIGGLLLHLLVDDKDAGVLWDRLVL